jgi:hypothetical protein
MADDVSDLQISGTRLSGNFTAIPFVKGKDLKQYEIEKPTGRTGKDEKLIELIK